MSPYTRSRDETRRSSVGQPRGYQLPQEECRDGPQKNSAPTRNHPSMQVYCRKAPDVRYCPRTLLDQKTNGRLTMATWPRMTEKVQECFPARSGMGPRYMTPVRAPVDTGLMPKGKQRRVRRSPDGSRPYLLATAAGR